ncbi:MAG: hypothetical protein HY716_02045 [Planctomycetes bacterium]|nr:hypothetical protein [Planctomycetota bacterium]
MSVLLAPLYIVRAVLSFLIRLPAAVLMFVAFGIWKLANWVSPTHSCEECEDDSSSDEHRPSAEILVIPDRVFRRMMRRGSVSVR